jgi:hypothetical protein
MSGKSSLSGFKKKLLPVWDDTVNLIIVGTRVAPVDLYKMIRDPHNGQVANPPLPTVLCQQFCSLMRSLKTGRRCGLKPPARKRFDEP